MPESFPMVSGDGTYSYTKNSKLQKMVSDVVKEKIQEAIVQSLDSKSLISTSNAFKIADLGCSIGPNTFSAMENVIQAIQNKCHLQGIDPKQHEFQVFFNDHAANDFNTLFTSLPPERQYFAAGVPGSFHTRVFPSSSIHLAHASFALHWLSKVPEEMLDRNSPAWNKGRIHRTGASDETLKAYAAQFQKDMGDFLKARSEELTPGGLLVLVMLATPDGIHHSEIPADIQYASLGTTLTEMVDEGLVSEDKVDSFNLPIYDPTLQEMTRMVEANGCFDIEKMEATNPWLYVPRPVNVGFFLATIRSAFEAVFTEHFGSETVDEMFKRTFARRDEIAKSLESSYKDRTLLFVVLKRK